MVNSTFTKSVYIHNQTVCPRRSVDAMQLVNYFKKNDYVIIDNPNIADFIILVTCAFSDEREDKSFEALTILRQYDGELVVIGCLPVSSPTKFNAGYNGKWIETKNLHLIDEIFPHSKVKFLDLPDANDYFPSAYTNVDKYRDSINAITIKSVSHKSILRINHGCVGNCSYCSIKKAVGDLKSKPLEVCLNEYKELLDKGYRHFEFIGDDTGAYGLDINSSFAELLDKMSIVDEGKKVMWEIEEVSPIWAVKYKKQLLKNIEDNKFTRLTICNQSCSARILRLMNRYDDVDAITATLLEFRKANINTRLIMQYILGFPTETEDDFNETITHIEKLRYDAVRVFKFSAKEATVAYNMDGKISEEVMKARKDRIVAYLEKNQIPYDTVGFES